LTELARAVDLSPGYLSTIENGASVPSLTVLARLAHALDVSLAEILRSSGNASVARGNITDGLDNRVLAPSGSDLEIVRHTAEPGEEGTAPVALGHGDVFVYLHAGELQVMVDDGTFKLSPGDALHGDRPRQMYWRALGSKRIWALWATSRRGPRSSSS
jgi:quercetin dioxygenase-like cupin family protein